MSKYKLTAATYVRDGIIYERGDVIESNDQLDKKFANAFENVDHMNVEVSEGRPLMEVSQPPASQATAVKEPEKKVSTANVPEDVTEQFADVCADTEITVAKEGNKYMIFDGSEEIHQDTAKERVAQFIKTYKESE